jgi:hypothetical protein
LQAKEDASKAENAKKESMEDDSVLADIETCSDSESHGESGEAFQGILNSYQDSLELWRTLLSLPRKWLLRIKSMESLTRQNLFHFKLLSQDRNQRNGLKRLNV